jgi:hypothetical protein
VPSFEKSPPHLVERFGELADRIPEADRRLTFGYPACTVNGNMFMSLHADRLILRLSDSDRAAFIDTYDAPIFEPMPGRPMREYVVVPDQLLAGHGVDDWVTRSLAYAVTLPTKQPKPRATKKR